MSDSMDTAKRDTPQVIHQNTTIDRDEEKEEVSKDVDAITSKSLSDAEQEKSNDPPKTEHEYPQGIKLWSIMMAAYLVIFLVALDKSIIATAIPRITDDFHSLNDIGWYGNAYLLTSCAFQLMLGRFYSFYSPKWVYLTSIVIFEVGSAVCGSAPNSVALIFGRAIAGLGSCGIMAGNIVIITDSVPLHRRPVWTGCLGAVMAVATVLGPLLGGVFTNKVSWRWCFYINLPIGALTMLIVMIMLPASPPPHPSKAKTVKERVKQLDLFGTAVFLPTIVCLTLALQWGGTTYAWNSDRIIVLFVLFGLLLAAFVLIQIWKQEFASVPPRIIKIRSIAAASFYALCDGGSMLVVVFYLSIWFQAIKDASPEKSGIMNLPLVLSLSFAAIIAGIGVSRLGYYVPFMYIAAVLTSISTGLLTTFTATTDHEKWIAYQFLYGFGVGMGKQMPSITAQTILERKDVPTGASLIFLVNSLGGAIFLPVAESVFTNSLVTHLEGALSGKAAPGFAQRIANNGATEIRNLVGNSSLGPVLNAYNAAVTDAFKVALVLSCLSVISPLLNKWVSIKKKGQPKKGSV